MNQELADDVDAVDKPYIDDSLGLLVEIVVVGLPVRNAELIEVLGFREHFELFHVNLTLCHKFLSDHFVDFVDFFNDIINTFLRHGVFKELLEFSEHDHVSVALKISIAHVKKVLELLKLIDNFVDGPHLAVHFEDIYLLLRNR